jgi:hypothetical protein
MTTLVEARAAGGVPVGFAAPYLLAVGAHVASYTVFLGITAALAAHHRSVRRSPGAMTLAAGGAPAPRGHTRAHAVCAWDFT